MTDDPDLTVLRRKAGAAQKPAGAAGGLDRALRMALTKAADGCHKLPMSVSRLSSARRPLDALLDDLPQEGLFLTLEGAGRDLGVAIFDLGFISGLIEVQTMGTVTNAPTEERRSTRTDARMVEPFLNTALSLFAEDADKLQAAAWLKDYNLGFRLEGPRVVGLILPERTFRCFDVTVEMNGGAKQGRLHLFLPEPAAPAPEKAAPQWQAGITAQVMASPVQLDAILLRLSLPLSQASALAVGDELPVPLSAVTEISIEGGDGTVAARGRLGQVNGMRALRLTTNTALPGAAPAEVPEPAPATEDPPSPTEAPSPSTDVALSDLMIAQAQEEQPA